MARLYRGTYKNKAPVPQTSESEEDELLRPESTTGLDTTMVPFDSVGQAEVEPKVEVPSSDTGGVVESVSQESSVETEPATPDTTACTAMDTTASSGTGEPKNLDHSTESHDSGNPENMDTVEKPNDSIAGMFQSVSMIDCHVKAHFPITARPPSVVDIDVVS